MKMRTILSQKENCVEVAGKFLFRTGVKVTNTTLENDLNNHPDYPSLLSISDVFARYGVQNISLKTSIEQLHNLPTPCIVPIKSQENGQNLFTVIDSVSGKSLNYYHPTKHRWKNIDVIDFEKQWSSGIVLLADTEDAHGEKEFGLNRREEKRLNIARYATFLSLPLLVIFTIFFSLIGQGAASVQPTIFTMLVLTGCIIGGLLLWYELDQYNPILQQICNSGKKANCGAILNSKQSKIGGISWSVIGFTYFTGSLITLLIFGVSNQTALYLLSWLNASDMTYVFFSVYYQWRIVNQWCVLCLCVQGILVLQLLTALAAKWHTITSLSAVFAMAALVPIILAFTIPFILISLLLPAYRTAKEGAHDKRELQRLKHRPEIFSALLGKQKAISESTEGLGIILGKKNAIHQIIKVCSPYCGPCAKAHSPIEELLANNPDVRIQIIFTASSDPGDIRMPPVAHFLSIAEKVEEANIKEALSDWYLADKKDYKVFAEKHPMYGKPDNQAEKLNAMSNWCSKMNITFTPTFFVNGHQLPDIYNVNDLKYFFSV